VRNSDWRGKRIKLQARSGNPFKCLLWVVTLMRSEMSVLLLYNRSLTYPVPSLFSYWPFPSVSVWPRNCSRMWKRNTADFETSDTCCSNYETNTFISVSAFQYVHCTYERDLCLAVDWYWRQLFLHHSRKLGQGKKFDVLSVNCCSTHQQNTNEISCTLSMKYMYVYIYIWISI
jgi:hypothetical protein